MKHVLNSVVGRLISASANKRAVVSLAVMGLAAMAAVSRGYGSAIQSNATINTVFADSTLTIAGSESCERD
jgi:hypothetical protein